MSRLPLSPRPQRVSALTGITMKQNCTPSIRRPLGFALLALAVCTTPAVVHAQEEGRRREAPPFKRGAAAVTNDDQPLLDKAAKFYVDRVTYREYQKAPAGEDSVRSPMAEIVSQAFLALPDGKKYELTDSQLDYMQHFAPPLI